MYSKVSEVVRPLVMGDGENGVYFPVDGGLG
jgi:hypothetical protein